MFGKDKGEAAASSVDLKSLHAKIGELTLDNHRGKRPAERHAALVQGFIKQVANRGPKRPRQDESRPE